MLDHTIQRDGQAGEENRCHQTVQLFTLAHALKYHKEHNDVRQGGVGALQTLVGAQQADACWAPRWNLRCSRLGGANDHVQPVGQVEDRAAVRGSLVEEEALGVDLRNFMIKQPRRGKEKVVETTGETQFTEPNAYVEKPVDPNELIKVIKENLED